MIRFAESFSDEAIVSTLWRQLSWSHFKEIIYQKDELQRDFYAEMCRIERWNVRTLRQKIDSMLFRDLDDFGKCRGQVAHNTKTTTGSINPEDEYNRVETLIKGLKVLDNKLSEVV